MYMNQALQLGEYSLGYYYRGTMYQSAGKKEAAIVDLSNFLMLITDASTYEKEVLDAQARLAELNP